MNFLKRRPFLLGSVLFMMGCASVGPDFIRPDPPQTKQYTQGKEVSETRSVDGVVQRFDTGVSVPENWWRLFNATKLDPIITKALDGNSNLEAAIETLKLSQENLKAGYGVFYPQVSAGAGASREKPDTGQFGSDATPGIFNLISLSGTVNYALDIFGGQRRAVEGLRAAVDVNRNLVLAAYLTLTGNLVNTIIARAAYQVEIDSTLEMIRIEKDQVVITNAQVKSGTTPYSDLLSIQSQLFTTEAMLPALNQKLNHSDHLLALLSGHAPSDSEPSDIVLSELTLPEVLPKTLPTLLVRQRPDILESEAELHIASANVGVATAALYPSFSLGGGYGVSKASGGGVDGPFASFWNIGANLTAPIFNGGSLRAARQSARDAFQASLSGYRQTVLNAFSQVADILRALEHDAEMLDSEEHALETSREALKLIQDNYAAGTANYLQVLTANSQFYQANISQVQAVAQRFQDTVALYLALGGGWQNTDQPLVDHLLDLKQKEKAGLDIMK